MTMTDKITYKALLILSSVFFIGMTGFGIIPSLITDVAIWEQSLSLKGFGLVFGFSFVISMISYIYVALSSLKPYKTSSNYIKIIHIIIFLILYIYILPDENYISNNIKIISFIFFGIVIITTNVIYYLKAKSSIESKEIFRNEEFISNLEPITNAKDGTFLFNLVFWAILMVVISNEDISSISGYILIILINAFILYNFIKATSSTKEEYKIIIVSAVILTIISIVLLEIAPNILVSKFGNFEFILLLLPSIYWFPKILKNYTVIRWKKYCE